MPSEQCKLITSFFLSFFFLMAVGLIQYTYMILFCKNYTLQIFLTAFKKFLKVKF